MPALAPRKLTPHGGHRVTVKQTTLTQQREWGCRGGQGFLPHSQQGPANAAPLLTTLQQPPTATRIKPRPPAPTAHQAQVSQARPSAPLGAAYPPPTQLSGRTAQPAATTGPLWGPPQWLPHHARLHMTLFGGWATPISSFVSVPMV